MIPDGAVDKVYDAMLNYARLDSPFDDLRGSIRDALNSIVADLLREAILTVEVDGRIVVVRTPTETQNVVERDVWNQLGDEIRNAGGVTLLVTTRDYDLTTLTLDDVRIPRNT